VSPDCATSPNYVNVSIAALNVVFTGAFTSTHGLPNPVFSCTDVPGTADLILTPTDIAASNALLGQMTDYIRAQASARGYAYVSLGELYDREDLKPAHYSVISQLTSQLPYGPYISLDGVHPNALGNAVIANAAAHALNVTYGLGAHALPPQAGGALANRSLLPSEALTQARRIVTQHAGERLSACVTSDACVLGGMRAGRQ
jgi:hypothetical protein